MEGPRYPPVLDAPLNGPTSPPTTSCAFPHPDYIHFADPPPPYEQHIGSLYPAPTPTLETVGRKAHTHNFFFARPQSLDSSSISSAASSPTKMEDELSVDDSESLVEEPSPLEEDKPVVTIKDGDFDVEEITEDDIGYDSDTEVVRPDGVEEATGQNPARNGPEDDAGISGRFEELNCDDESLNTDEEQRRRFERRKKRWSVRPFKRTHSQSIGSDTDDADLDGLGSHEAGSNARRLRRKLNGAPGAGDRSSLIFEDLGDSYTLTEEQEQDHGSGGSTTRLASDPPDLGGLHTLPFWVLQDPMELDSGSSGPPSVA